MKNSISRESPRTKTRRSVKRVGLFGGPFDPIHLGHLQAAKEVLKGFFLDTILFIPSFLPPHKQISALAGIHDRLEMIRLAISRHPRFSYSDIEIRRTGYSYTIDTVNALIETSPQEIRFYLIIGHDAFLEIHTWKSYKKLFQILPLILLIRPGRINLNSRQARKTIGTYLRRRISPRYRFSSIQSGFFHPDQHPVYLFNHHLLDISSTSIRNRIKHGESIRSLVPREVMKWISQKGLYR
ncbi:MAG: nicotinate-nucleotide adenylyltransferase [Thermodesulfobacteriota bacterium]